MSASALRALSIVTGLCAFILLTTNVSAQEGQTEVIPQAPAVDPITAAEQSIVLEDSAGVAQTVPGASAFGIFRVILTLALAAAAIYGLVFFIKRVSRGGRAQDPFLKILASTPLGNNRSAHIIAAGSKAWLVGSAENGVNLISEIEDKDLLNAMFLEDSRRSAAPGEGAAGTGGLTGRLPDFKALLRRLGMPMEAGAPGPESIRQRRDKLKGL